jgi:predicted RNA binding protein YcfA (HicA-like mRNA interferase family)
MPKKQNITNKQFQKFLIYIGCSLKRSHGDHFIYVRSRLNRPIVIPKDSPIPQFIIRNNLRILNITWEEFFHIMENL